VEVSPTKANLIAAKKTLALSRQGYELLDKKRNILVREIMKLNKKAKELQEVVDSTFSEAYRSLQNANIENGINRVERLSHGVKEEDSVKIQRRSVMGVEIPVISYENSTSALPTYGFGDISSSLDKAVYDFNKLKDLIIVLAMTENSIYRLSMNIKKTRTRANALKNITIPKYTIIVKNIQDVLEEHERDEFTRLKVVKKKKQ
jgi:V/A-type H+-transporting ATPase subunit D